MKFCLVFEASLRKMAASIDISFRCTKCDFYTLKVDVMQKHLKQSGSLFDCIFCEKVFCTEENLQTHYQKEHILEENKASENNPKNIIMCAFCGENFGRNVHKFRKHLASFHPLNKGQKFDCKDCGKIFSSYEKLSYHRDYQHNYRKRKVLKCDHCTKTYFLNWALKQHIRSHFPDYQCDKCDKTFGSKATFTYHQKLVECEEKKRKKRNNNYMCGECNKTFTQKTNLKTHVKTFHQGSGYVRFKCDQCDQEFKSKGARYNHKQQSHPTASTKKYFCKKCSYSTYTKALFKFHLINKHE